MHSRSKSDVLLTELIVVILVFSLVATVVVQMFAAAHKASARNARLERALVAAQDCAERLSGEQDPAAVLRKAGFRRANRVEEDAFVLRRANAGPDNLPDSIAGLSDLVVEARLQPETRSGAGRLLCATVSVFEAGAYGARRDAGREPAEPLVVLPVLSYISGEEVRP